MLMQIGRNVENVTARDGTVRKLHYFLASASNYSHFQKLQLVLKHVINLSERVRKSHYFRKY